MQKQLISCFALLTLLSGCNDKAPEATEQGANDLKQKIVRYTGVESFDKGRVKVTPSGSDYAFDVDLTSFVTAGNASDGVRVTPGTITPRIRPLEDGTYAVSSNLPSILEVGAGDKATTYNFTNFAMDGIFDPALGSFRSAKMSFDQASTKSSGSPSYVSEEKGRTILFKSAADPSDPAKMNIDVEHRSGGFSLAIDGPLVGGVGRKVTSGAGESTGSMSIKGLRAVQVMQVVGDLLKQSEDGQPLSDAVKTAAVARLLALLPLWTEASGQSTMADFFVDTPAGRIGAKSLRISLGTPSTESGSVIQVGTSVSGLDLGILGIPSEVKALLPTETSVHVAIFGLPFSEIGQKLAAAQKGPYGQPDPAAVAELAEIYKRANVRVAIADMQLKLPSATFKVSGDLNLTSIFSRGTFTITCDNASGFAEALLKAGGGDPKLLGAAEMVKKSIEISTGAVPPDASSAASTQAPAVRNLTWNVKYDSAMGISINGSPYLPLTKPSKLTMGR